MSHRGDNEEINRFVESIFLHKECKSEEELSEAYINQLTKKIDNCSNLTNENLSVALFYYQTTDVQTHFLNKIQQAADHLWNEWMKRGYIYKDYELQFLRNVYQLNTKLMNSDQFDHTGEARRHDRQINASPFYKFKTSVFIVPYYGTLRSVLSSLNNPIFPSSECSGLPELIMWLDMFTTFNQRCRFEDGSFKSEIDLIQPCILSVQYKKYLSSYIINRDITIIQKFYIGTCSSFCASLSSHRLPDEKLRWCNLVESLLFYLHRFILGSTQIIEQWTDTLVYCVTGVVTLITNYYCLKIDVEEHPLLHPRLIHGYKQFFQMLLNILKQDRFQKQIVLIDMNNETQLIDSIIRYMLVVSTNYDDIKYFFRSLDASIIVVKYLETAHTQISRNTLYLLTIICTDNDLRRLKIAEKLTLTYLQFFENFSKQSTYQSSSTSYESRSPNTLRDIDFDYFLLLVQNTSIQEAVVRLDAMKYIVQYQTQDKPKQMTEIIWALSFHPLMQKQLKKDELLLTSIRNYHYNNDERKNNILWTLGDHIGLAKLEFNAKYNTEQLEKIASYKLILNFSYEDAKIGTNISDNLRLHGFPALCDLSISLLQLNTLDFVTHIIIGLSEYYERSNLCRAIHQYSIKKQLNIIPIIIQKHYKPQGWITEIPLRTCIIDFTETSFITALETLIYILKTSTEKKLEVSIGEAAKDDFDQSENMSLELFSVCKNNDIEKLKYYLKKMTVEQINRIGPNGSTALHIAAYYRHKEIIQLLLASGTSRSVRNAITNLTAYEEAPTLEIRQLFKRSDDINRFLADSSLHSFEWTLHYDDPTFQRSQFRRQLLNPFKVDRRNVRTTLDNNQLSLIFREVLTKFCENFFTQLSTDEISSQHKALIEWFFKQAVETTNAVYILKAYTSTTNFYRVLNKTLAQSALGYFDAVLQESINYKAITPIINLISLLIYDPDLDKYDFRGKTYRGMLFQEKDFLKYVVGSKLMNISLVSTSKNRDVAEIYAGGIETTSLTPSSENNLTQISSICVYIIKNEGTALDIEQISEISDECEVLLLPFSAFRIRCIRRIDKTVNRGITVELELEECEECCQNESARDKKLRLLMPLLQQQQQNNGLSLQWCSLKKSVFVF